MDLPAPLYGLPRPKSKPTTTPASLTFTSTLSSLLATSTSTSSSTPTGRARPRPSKKNPSDIFTTHNKNTKKRALADDSPCHQAHRPYAEAVDAATLHRSKRKLEEKARLYASMKRGDYVPPTSGRGVDQEANALVDFDRKWADGAAVNGEGEEEDDDDDTTSSSVGGDSDGDGDGETVEYEDEFGRLRRGTKADAAKEIRRNKARSYAASELREYSARPQRPDRLIHGDAIQTAAFDPDATIAAQMESLARKRDRSPTPPESVHYDASKEVRSKGVGFYAFSRDGETRKGEMEALERERGETEKRKREREAQKERRRKEVVERKRVIAEKRDRKEADRFLETL